MKNVLFVCSQNKYRSPTAEQMFFSKPGICVKSAGTDIDAKIFLSSELIDWADIIFVMESSHRNKIRKKFKRVMGPQLIYCLNIPDDFEYMDSELIEILRKKVTPILDNIINEN